MLISPKIMTMIAEKKGYKREDVEQRLGDDIIIYPSCYVSPCKTIRYPEAFACHQVYGSWRKRRFGRKIERFLKHICLVVRFALFKRQKKIGYGESEKTLIGLEYLKVDNRLPELFHFPFIP